MTSSLRRVRDASWWTTLREDFFMSGSQAASRRWARNNAMIKAEGCPCGGPAEIVIQNYQVIGDVPAEYWTCKEHAGATAWSDGMAMFEHSVKCPLDMSSISSGSTGCPATSWWCPHRTHKES